MRIEKIYPVTRLQGSIICGYLASDKKDYVGQLTLPVTDINSVSLNRALQLLYARHEALRTAFDWQNPNGITAVVADHLPDINHINEYVIDNIDQIDHIKSKEAEILELSKPPLIRIALIHCNSNDYLLWTRHHAITDQESIKIFWNELWNYYRNPTVQLPTVSSFSQFAIGKHNKISDTPQYHDYLPFVEDVRIENSYTLLPSELASMYESQKISNVTLAAYTLSSFCLALSDVLSSDSFTVGYVESDRPQNFRNSIGLFIKESLIRQDQGDINTIGEHRSYIFKSLLSQKKSNYNHSTSQKKNQIGFLFEDDPDSQSLDTVESDAGIQVRLKIFCRVSLFQGKLSINLSSQTQVIRSNNLDVIQQKMVDYMLKESSQKIQAGNKILVQQLNELIWRNWRNRSDVILVDSNQKLTGTSLYSKVVECSELFLSYTSRSTNKIILIKPTRSIQCVVNILSAIHAGFPFLISEESELSNLDVKISDDVQISTLDHNLPINTVYLIRTSGSTGAAKTVLIHIKNLISHLLYRISDNTYASRVAHTSAWTFDASLTILFSTMVKGGFLSIFPLVTDYSQPDELFKQITSTKINEINMVPSLLRLLVSYGLEKTSVHTITSAGEELTAELANTVFNQSSIQLINEYGPSECTILSTRSLVSGSHLPNPSIGQPIDGCNIELRDIENLAGEICISGNYVGLGYLGDLDRNQTSFFYDRDFLWYRTGDVGRWDDNGNLNWLGRIDQQLKINGKIFNPEFLENDLIKLGAEETKCIFTNSIIHIFYSCNDTNLIKHEHLKALYREKFGIVCVFHSLKQLPKNSSGKIDVQSLRKHISVHSNTLSQSIEKSKIHLKIESVLGRTIHLQYKPLLDIDSLQAIRLISSINKSYSTNLSVSSLLSSASWSDFMLLFSDSNVSEHSNLPVKIKSIKRKYQ